MLIYRLYVMENTFAVYCPQIWLLALAVLVCWIIQAGRTWALDHNLVYTGSTPNRDFSVTSLLDHCPVMGVTYNQGPKIVEHSRLDGLWSGPRRLDLVDPVPAQGARR